MKTTGAQRKKISVTVGQVEEAFMQYAATTSPAPEVAWNRFWSFLIRIRNRDKQAARRRLFELGRREDDI